MSMDKEEKVFWIWLCSIISAIVGGIILLLVFVARADGKSDYCYTETIGLVVVLKAHRPWRSDTMIQVVKDAAEAKRAAEDSGCVLK